MKNKETGLSLKEKKQNPFLTNEGFLDITIKRELEKTFNKHYINIVEKSTGIKPKDISWKKSECSENNHGNFQILQEIF